MATEYAEHVCQCPACCPDLFPEAPAPLHEGHHAVRWGHVTRNTGLRYAVILDGEDVAEDAFEAMPGPNGWAYCWSRPRHICHCGGRDACRHVIHGNVRIVVTPAVWEEVADGD